MRYKYEDAMKIANEIKDWLSPYCEKIIVCGSLRRKKAEVGDIEILCVPHGVFELEVFNLIREKKLDYRLNKKGSRTCGKQNKLLVHCASGIPVDIFSTTDENWWVALTIRTGSKESNIKICMAAKKEGLKFNAYGSGFTRMDGSGGKNICHSEEAVFNAVGLPYKPPEER